MLRISSNRVVGHAFFWVTAALIKGFGVTILTLREFLSHAMLSLMNVRSPSLVIRTIHHLHSWIYHLFSNPNILHACCPEPHQCLYPLHLPAPISPPLPHHVQFVKTRRGPLLPQLRVLPCMNKSPTRRCLLLHHRRALLQIQPLICSPIHNQCPLIL